jgi:hypothetical protein
MYLLKRTISPYTGSDILLGCFNNLHEAQGARERYILQYKNNEKDDPWKGQAFHTVNLEEDVIILDDIPEFDIHPEVEKVTLVISFAEGFGQEVTRIHAICGSADATRSQFSKIQKGLEGHWPTTWMTRKVVVGELLSDDKDRMILAPHVIALKELKKSKNYRSAEKLLVDLLEYNESKNIQDGLGVPDWYYFELAKLYRKQKNYSKEVAILEKYAKQEYIFGGIAKVLLERLDRAKELLATKSKYSRQNRA